jgi:hypothetical protein
MTESEDMELNDGYFVNNYYQGEKLFIKSLYFNNKLVAFIYHKENENDLHVELFELSYKNSKYNISYKCYESKWVNNANSFNFEQSLSDFVKINNNRLAFIYTYSNNIGILIINLSKNLNDMCMVYI